MEQLEFKDSRVQLAQKAKQEPQVSQAIRVPQVRRVYKAI
jgi:hypothetical protein